MKLAFLVLALAALPASGRAATSPKAPAFSVSAGDITDRRRNDNSFAELEIELKVAGAGLEGVRAARVLVTRAVDDTGRNLVPDSRKSQDFERAGGEGSLVLKISLKNPVRRAAAVKELSGQVEIFLPSRDPAAAARVDKFSSQVDRPLAASALKAAGVQVTVVSRQTYEEEKKKNEERRKKDAETSGLSGAMAEAFGRLFQSMMGDVGENDVLLRVSDEKKKVFSVEILDAAGKKIDNRGSTKIGEFWILNFPAKLPADASLQIYVLTPAAVVSSPFSLKDVALP